MQNKLIISLVIIAFLLLGGFFYFKHLEKERHKFKVVFLNVGQGDSALIQFENSEKMLVDCGPGRDILSALGRRMFFFERTIDYLLITHPDLDHYGGCLDVIKKYKIQNVITNGKSKNDPVFRELLDLVKKEGAREKIVSLSELQIISNTKLRFISPDINLPLELKTSDNNNYSIVFKLETESGSYLFAGDMEEPLEKILIQKYCPEENCETLKSNVLKVGHHGSDSSSSETFLKYVDPDEAVISVGKNKFGHPSLRVLRHLERVGAKILRTDESGDLLF